MIKIRNICCVSSQLFLIASIINYNYENYWCSYYIFLMYMSSILYHSTGNIVIRKIDIFVTKFVILLCIMFSICYNNIYPSLFTGFIMIAYNPKKSNMYHAIFVHIPGFCGFVALCI